MTSLVLPPNTLSHRRLPVFQSFTAAPLLKAPSRHIRIAGLDWRDCEEERMEGLVGRFGAVQCLDLQEMATGEAIVSYYDIRHSLLAFSALSLTWDCEFLPPPLFPEYTDFLVFHDTSESQVQELVSVLSDFGEVEGYMKAGNLVCVQFFDTRVRAKAYFELAKLNWLERYEDVLDTSELSYSPAPAPALVHTSPGDTLSDSTTSSPSSLPDPCDFKPESDPTPPSFSIDLLSIAAGKDLRTSIMIKNIPNKYSQQLLLEVIDKDYKGLYDFFYLPIDFKNKCNVGYAFLNFLRPESVVRFYEQYNDAKWGMFNSTKVCEVTYGRIQGRSALIQHFQASSVMSHEDARVKPVILPLLAKCY